MISQAFDIKGFTVHILSTDDGIVVDIYDREELKHFDAQPIASTYAFDNETTKEI